jgi:hypothetical protein
MPYQQARPDGPTMTPAEIEEWEQKLKDETLFETVTLAAVCCCGHTKQRHERRTSYCRACLCGGFLEQ